MSSSNKLWNISIQQIQIFIKAVELRNFTKVAEHYNFTPSMVSKTISSLEAEMGIKLFIRKPHELTPTPAGSLLASEWRRLVGSFQNDIKKAHSLQNGQTTKIVLGFVDSSNVVDQFMEKSILEYSALKPSIHVIAEKHDMHRLSELLRNGMLDIIQTSDMEAPYLDEHHLPWEKVCSSQTAVYVPRKNPLFDRDSLTFDDIADQELIALEPSMHPPYHARLTALGRKYGFVPNVTATYRTVRSLLFSLRIQSQIFIGDTITSDWCDGNLICFPLEEPTFSLIAWNANPSQELLEFKEFLKKRYPQNV